MEELFRVGESRLGGIVFVFNGGVRRVELLDLDAFLRERVLELCDTSVLRIK